MPLGRLSYGRAAPSFVTAFSGRFFSYGEFRLAAPRTPFLRAASAEVALHVELALHVEVTSHVEATLRVELALHVEVALRTELALRTKVALHAEVTLRAEAALRAELALCGGRVAVFPRFRRIG